jgi:Uma2 family endonuclease
MATITTRIGPLDNGRAMTIDEFLEAEEELGYRYELARGVLEVTHVPGPTHGQVVCNLYRIVAFYDHFRQGFILRWGGGSEFRLWLPAMTSGRNPDLAVVLAASPKNLDGDRAPALVAEVVSKSSVDRDYKAKREEYLAFGLLEYWIIDYLDRKLTLLVRNGDVWVEVLCPEDQPIPSLVLPGLTATVSDLWTSLDEYDSEDVIEE